MRMSTLGSHYSLVNQMLRQQSEMARTQMQVSTQRRVLTPADDPIAAGRILSLETQISAYAQYERNTNAVQTRLSIEEQALADAGTVLRRVRDLTLQANSGALDDVSRAAIATELDERIRELQAIGNRRDASGEFLFAGHSTGTQPFVRTAAGMAYAGDQGVREVQVSPTQSVRTGHDGFDVFMDVAAGNGSFIVDAGALNAGSGWIAPLTVVDEAAWTGGSYTLRFVDAAGYEILDTSGVQVATGSFASGDAIDFAGVRFSITGAPAAGDTFTIAAAGRQDLFTSLDRLAATLRLPTGTERERAHFSTGITTSLGAIDARLDHLLDVRAQVGARLNVIDNVNAARDGLELELQSAVSTLRDVDPVEAISRLVMQQNALTAAQKSFAQFSQLSLFDYL
ncbi:MAG TPA: flagellar hook-associated protein FlgL [Steroidobacteraceae bacterium]|nr:flagellar hook-associated protein FlgL [Steroidobacteraceae bacterium]